MNQSSSTDADFADTKPETRGRKPLGGAPRQSQSFNLTDRELAHLNDCDPSGKRNRAAGLRALIAASMARKAAAAAQSASESASQKIA